RRPWLEGAGTAGDAGEVVFAGLDRGIEGGVEQDYRRSLPLTEAMRDEVLLAYAVQHQPLPPQHGFPLRLVVPGWYGMTNVKWLSSIQVTDRPFTGYYQATSYNVRNTDEEPGEPVTRIVPRSLMVPPGIPDFYTRVRRVPTGPCALAG